MPAATSPVNRPPVASGSPLASPAGFDSQAFQVVLHQRPGGIVEGLDAQCVGDQPVGTGRQLAGQIAVAPARHFLWCRRDHVEVGDHHLGRRTGNGVLEALDRQRRSGAGIAVHRRRRRHRHIGNAQLEGRVLDQIVDHARADRHRDAAAFLHAGNQDLGVLDRPFQARRSREGLAGHREALLLENPGQPRPGRLPSIVVGDEEHLAVIEMRAQQIGNLTQRPTLHDDGVDHLRPGDDGLQNRFLFLDRVGHGSLRGSDFRSGLVTGRPRRR